MKKTITTLSKAITALCLGLSTAGLAQVTQTFTYTGSAQSFTVPACVAQVTITVNGANGANGATAPIGGQSNGAIGGNGGQGSQVSGVYPVTNGQVFNIYVGGAAVGATGGYNGGGNGDHSSGGGGGASDIRTGGTALANRIIVAGGGGGGGNGGCSSFTVTGGNGGNGSSNGSNGLNSIAGGAGQGGNGSTGGATGIGCPLASGNAGSNGTSGVGGNGGFGPSICGAFVSGGAGGGGYVGGGGGGGGTAGTTSCTLNDQGSGGGGAGGSNYFDPAFTSTVITNGISSGDGSVVITYAVSNPPTTISVNNATVCPAGATSATLTASGATSYSWSTGDVGSSTVVSPTSNTVYTVTAWDIAGCANTNTVSVTIGSLPTISITGNTTVCTGSSTTLTASGANTFTWNPIDKPLDYLPAYQFAIGLRKLTSTYSGPAVRIRRSSDNVEQDFGFAGTDLDVTSIIAFLGGAPGYCTTMYDQSGNGNHVSQTNASQQPLFVMSGLNGKPVIRFDGSASQQLYNTTNYPAPFTAIYTAQQNGPNRQRMLTSVSNNWLLGWWSGANNQAYFEGWITPNPGNPGADSNPYIYSGTSDGVSTSNVYQNGIFQYGNGNGITGPNGIALGAWMSTNEASDGDFTEVFMFNSVLPDVYRQLVETSTGAYYGFNNVATSTGASSVVSPTTSTTYYVIGTDNNGCVNSITTTVNTITLPTITASSGTICAGDSYTITTSGANTYTFSSGNDVVAPTTNTTYTITGTDANNCNNFTTTTVTVNPIPVLSNNSGSTHTCEGGTAVFSLNSDSPATDTYQWSWFNVSTPNSLTADIGTYQESGYTTGSMTISPMTNSTWGASGTWGVSCSVTNTLGCAVQSVVDTIFINALPTITINGGSICMGQSFTISPTGATSYTFSGGNAVVTPTATATYTITGSDANGCVNNNTVQVVVNSMPDTSVAIASGAGQIITSNAVSATYQWVNCATNYSNIAGETAQSYTPATNGNYAVIVTQNGCVDTSACHTISAVGINYLSANNTISIYPNPNNGSFVVEPSNNTTQIVYVYDVNGNLVLTQTINGTTTINANHLSDGVYNVNITNNQGVVNKRLVIVR